MTIRLGINGFGRIGRCALRALYEEKLWDDVKVVAVNATGPIETNRLLLRHDSTHGLFNAEVEVADGRDLVVNGDRIRTFSTYNPEETDWGSCGVDVVLECTGKFRTRDTAGVHLKTGAKKVLISAPSKDADAMVVFGVNEGILTPEMKVVSNGSCTTNGLAPLAKALNRRLGIVHGLMTTVHAVTNDQVLLDRNHKDIRRARSAIASMIPTKTGAAKAIGVVLPELAGRLDGFAMRVPTMDVSFVDLTFEAARETTPEEVNAIMKDEASKPDYKGVLAYSDEMLVSCDFCHTSASSTFDATLTRVIGGRSNFVKVGSWYDNEWGFSCRMLDTARAMALAK
ncbi:type I glyceraldehyde-3-phosphate dehydrogenase [Mesosutterella sp. AGMB02718]|uniref:Type I glyceraldehyde-3-phosphate dehydrogenase n=1 Tax=Mesosutterella faecium TaxID=2925194 RepID=A0ABT7IJP6_9BURK|nr:type I glyceraldehyde-3-phosphate dehydrogenase [Mesosutterella sp. AGMB02718]MDL2058589.1 type I glyceraldehyde-3-phosphate dehydrogenase [Mesosutterella sp. AGMB02718]